MKEIVYSKRNYLQNNGINVVFKIDCKPRQVIVRQNLFRKLDKCEIYLYFISLG